MRNGAPKPPDRFGQMKPIVPAPTSTSHSPMAGPERGAHQLAARQALDLLLAEGLDRLLGQGLGLGGGLDVVVAHARSVVLIRRVVTGRSTRQGRSRTG